MVSATSCLSAFDVAPTFQPAARSVSATLPASPAVAVPFSTVTLTLGSSVGAAVAAGGGADCVAEAVGVLSMPLFRSMIATAPAAISTTVASAAQPTATQPRP